MGKWFNPKWLSVILSLIFGGAGWFAKDINLNGVSGATEPLALGGLTVAGLVGVFYVLFQEWSQFDGKLDGQLSEQAAQAMADHGAPHRLHVVRQHMIAARLQRLGTTRAHQGSWLPRHRQPQ